MDSKNSTLTMIRMAIEKGEISIKDIEEMKAETKINTLTEILHTLLCRETHIQMANSIPYEGYKQTGGCAFYMEDSHESPWNLPGHKKWLEATSYVLKTSGQSAQEMLDDIADSKEYLSPMVLQRWIVQFYGAYRYGWDMLSTVEAVAKIVCPLVQNSDKEES